MNVENYYQRDSPIHRLSPTVKLCCLIIFSSALFLTSNLLVLNISLLVTLFLYLIAKVPLQKILVQLRPICMMLIIVLISYNSWTVGLKAAIRFGVLILFSSLITLTTRISDMTDSIEKLLVVSSHIGLDHRKISLAISLALRFIPVISSSFQEIRIAQRARGLDRNFITMVIPTIIKTLKMAENIAEAIEARSW
ncbi:energy-coupling factor transporter transmembrane protein EcfT [Cardinium endosymbiont of Tipula unca]|uniref:energy-coupling factor transporter transmembrane component T family protein n=1 Tax=Cardinium endosymbiont of Tipula unca TaxID=3066216 RepID=UPI0030CAF1A6